MADLKRALRQFLKSEDGPTAVEYAVMLSMIIMICIGAVRALGTQTNSLLENADEQIRAASS